MKKILLLMCTICLMVSCSTKEPYEVLVDNLTKELGTPEQVDTDDPTDLFHMWTEVDLGNSKKLIGICDKSMGMLPTSRKSDGIVEVRNYETPKFKVVFEIVPYRKADDDFSAKVKIFTQIK